MSARRGRSVCVLPGGGWRARGSGPPGGRGPPLGSRCPERPHPVHAPTPSSGPPSPGPRHPSPAPDFQILPCPDTPQPLPAPRSRSRVCGKPEQDRRDPHLRRGAVGSHLLPARVTASLFPNNPSRARGARLPECASPGVAMRAWASSASRCRWRRPPGSRRLGLQGCWVGSAHPRARAANSGRGNRKAH